MPQATVSFLDQSGARMAGEETPGPGQAFAALMSGAASAAKPAPDADAAPFGWMVDEETGERRPKKALGRPRKSPPIDELKAAAEASGAEKPAEAPEDRTPSRVRGKRSKAGSGDPDAAAGASVPQHRPGVITKGVNRLYRKAGRIVKAMDRDIGVAIIESTHNADEDGGDDSVGAAWEEVCRTNPRIRRFMLKVIAGGAWGQLLMAHAPILLAILLKDGISKHIPFARLITAFMEPDDDATPAEKAAAMTPADLGEMMNIAQGMMAKMGMSMPAPAPPAGGRRAAPPAEATEAA